MFYIGFHRIYIGFHGNLLGSISSSCRNWKIGWIHVNPNGWPSQVWGIKTSHVIGCYWDIIGIISGQHIAKWYRFVIFFQLFNWRFAMAIWWDRNHHRFHCPDVPHPPGAPASCVMNICLGQNRLEDSRCWKGIWNRTIKESRLQQDQQGFVKLQWIVWYLVHKYLVTCIKQLGKSPQSLQRNMFETSLMPPWEFSGDWLRLLHWRSCAGYKATSAKSLAHGNTNYGDPMSTYEYHSVNFPSHLMEGIPPQSCSTEWIWVVSCNNQCKPNFEEQRLGPQLHQLLHHGLVHELDVRPVRKLMNAGVHVQPPWVIIECGTWGLNHQKFAPDMCFPREFPAKVRNGKFPKQVPSLVRPPPKKELGKFL